MVTFGEFKAQLTEQGFGGINENEIKKVYFKLCAALNNDEAAEKLKSFFPTGQFGISKELRGDRLIELVCSDNASDRLVADFYTKFMTMLFENAIDVADFDGDIDCAEIEEAAARDYFSLLKPVHKGKKPEKIELDEDDPYYIKADSFEYDFDELIPCEDEERREMMMEIESLFADGASFRNVSERLSFLVENEWDN